MADSTDIRVGGLRGSVAGEGRDLVCLHGLTAARRYVLHGSSYLARHGFRVLAYDARGHGESAPAPDRGDYEYADLADDLRTVLDDRGLERPLLAGVSMGAHTALALALDEPERVGGLVLITPAYDGAPRAGADLDDWDAMADALAAGDVEGFLARSEVASVPEPFRSSALTAVRQRLERHADLAAVADATRVVPRSAAFDGLAGLDELDVPVLVVASRDEADPSHPLEVAREYARRLPRADLVVEEEGESPLAWRGTQLSKAIEEWAGSA